MISGINHITLSVSGLQVSFDFYSRVLGFQPLARWKKGAYFLVGDLWFCITEDSKTREGALPEYTHIAFSVSEDLFNPMKNRILEFGTKIWKENSSPGDSLYFLDPDGHKLELHASNWQTRLKVAKEENWEGMEFFVDVL